MLATELRVDSCDLIPVTRAVFLSPCASCCLSGYSTSQPDIQPLGVCAACSQMNISSADKNKLPLPCTNVHEQPTVVMLKSQEKMSLSLFYYFHDQWCSLGEVVLLAV